MGWLVVVEGSDLTIQEEDPVLLVWIPSRSTADCADSKRSTIPSNIMRVYVVVVLFMFLTMACSYPPRYARHRYRHRARYADKIEGQRTRDAAGLPGNSTTTASITEKSHSSAEVDRHSTYYARGERGASGTGRLKVEV